MAELILPTRELVPTFDSPHDDDLVKLIYHPLTGVVYRQRFRMALQALDRTGPYDRILEVGCGAGLLLPSLARLCGHVDAVDVHAQVPGVQAMVKQLDLAGVHVRTGSVFQLPYDDRTFSHVVSVSVLEQLTDLDTAIRELARVTRTGGRIVLGIPTKNWITRTLFRMVGYDVDDIHPSSHQDILAAARSVLPVERISVFPRCVPVDLSLYVVARMTGGQTHRASR